MSRTSRPHRLAAGLSAAALICLSLGATTGAHAVTLDGPLMNYVVNTKATPGHVRKTEDAVKSAGGTVLVSYRQLGVVIAQSTNPDFRTDVRGGHNGREIQSVGATRTAAVSEGAGGLNAAEATPTPDPREVDQWDMVQIKADQAHAVTDGSRDVLVGINDSGVDDTTPISHRTSTRPIRSVA